MAFNRYSATTAIPKSPRPSIVDPETGEIAWPHPDLKSELEALGLLTSTDHLVDIRDAFSGHSDDIQ